MKIPMVPAPVVLAATLTLTGLILGYYYDKKITAKFNECVGVSFESGIPKCVENPEFEITLLKLCSKPEDEIGTKDKQICLSTKELRKKRVDSWKPMVFS